jgi:tRNA(Ile)-lysidine synthetase-like protein
LTEGEHEIAACGVRVSFARIDGHTAITSNSNRKTNVYNPFIRDTLTFDIIIPYVTDGSLYLRPRREGDRILLGGMHRRVRKLQNERGIPPALRDRLPLLCDGEGVLWVPGVGLRDGTSSKDAPTARITLTLARPHDNNQEHSAGR